MSVRGSRIGLLLLVLAALAVRAEPVALSQAAARETLAARLGATQSLTAAFHQRVTDASGTLVEEGSGRFWLARPDRFRWEYEAPWPRLLLADGRRVWLYDKELEQVTVRALAGALDNTPAALLAGDTSRLDEYAVSARRDGNVLAVTLKPEARRSDFQRIEMAFVAGALQRLQLLDQFGQQTRIDFSAVVVNPGIDDALFEFVVPDGVDVIDETGEQPEGSGGVAE